MVVISSQLILATACEGVLNKMPFSLISITLPLNLSFIQLIPTIIEKLIFANIETGKISFKSPYPERIDHNMYTTSKITSNPIWQKIKLSIFLLLKPISKKFLLSSYNAAISGLKWWVIMCSEAKPNPLF